MNLEQQRKEALQLVDVAAGLARRRYITDVTGQQAVYQVKLEEAKEYLAALQVDANAVPGAHIAMEATATGFTPLQLAQTVVATGVYWLTHISPTIEAARMRGKERVNAATTGEEIDAALSDACYAIGQV